MMYIILKEMMLFLMNYKPLSQIREDNWSEDIQYFKTKHRFMMFITLKVMMLFEMNYKPLSQIRKDNWSEDFRYF